MKRWKRHCRGAISIFLIIIFLMSYLVVGALVDGGRHKMAQAMAESALDSATTSVLSYYNKLLFDLYGLYGTDCLTQEKITELMENYVTKTLGVAEVDAQSGQDMIRTLMSSITGEDDSAETQSFFDGYDFEVDVAGGNGITLADSNYVEYQIIEHMKYRAPMALATGVGGFLNKLDGLFDVADRIAIVAEKMNATEAKKGLFQKAEALISEIAQFGTDMLAFSEDPEKKGVPGATHWKNPWEYITVFDSALKDAASDYKEGVESLDAEANAPQPEGEGDDADAGVAVDQTAQRKALLTALKEDYDKAEDELLQCFDNIQVQAAVLHTEANSIRDKMEGLLGEYEQYIQELRGKVAAKPGDENVKTVYLPEIELAESYCGEMLKNMDLILNSRQMTDEIQMASYRSMLASVTEKVIDVRLETLDAPVAALKNELGKSGVTAGTALDDLHLNLNGVYTLATDFRNTHNPEIDVQEVNPNGAYVKEKEKEKEQTARGESASPLRELNGEDIRIDIPPLGDLGGSLALPDSLSAEEAAKTLKAGADLITKLGALLESARDGLYISEYAVEYFPNYVESYTDGKIAWERQALLYNEGTHAPYSASQAELEYVITGNPNTAVSMFDIRARLLGIRTVLNTAAIFSDSAKIAQANTLAAAISGPFAPIVSVGLLIAWAVAESVIDVVNLMDGEAVLLFKNGNDWELCAEGILSNAISTAVEYGVETAISQAMKLVDDYRQKAENVSNQAIYRAYAVASAGSSNAVGEAQRTLQSWSENMSAELNTLPTEDQLAAQAMQEANKTLTDTFSSSLSTVGNEVESLTASVRDKAALTVKKALDKAQKELEAKLTSVGSKFSSKVVNAITNRVSGMIPVGEVVSTGKGEGSTDSAAAVKLNYMDYMRIFLLFCSNATKTQRIQQLIQANLRYDQKDESGQGASFRLNEAYATVNANMDCSIKFLFLSQTLLPSTFRKDGRLEFMVYSNLSY